MSGSLGLLSCAGALFFKCWILVRKQESRRETWAKPLASRTCAELWALAPKDNLPPSAGGLSKCSLQRGSDLLSLPPALSLFFLRKEDKP